MKKRYPYYETTVFADLREMTENVARKFPDRIAISYKQRPQDSQIVRVTYAEARRRIRSIGTGLIELGCRERPVALIGESSYDWVCTYFALMAIGSIVVPPEKDLPAAELSALLNMAECEGLVYSAAIEAKAMNVAAAVPTLRARICMAGHPRAADPAGITDMDAVADAGAALLAGGDTRYDDYPLDPDRLATIVFTSGTTGRGKGVMLTQRNIALDMTNGMYLFAITPKTLNVLPPHHTFGSTVNFVGHFAQGSEIYISSGLRYIGAEIKEQQPSHLVLVPLFIEKLHQKIWQGAEESGKAGLLRTLIRISNALRRVGIDLRQPLFRSVRAGLGGRLELVISGGAALRQEFIDTFDAIGITVLNGYGITECAPLVTCNRNRLQKRDSVGLPIIGESIRIRAPNENGEGEICVKGPNVMLGYYKDPEATAAAFDAEGYFRTGDYGRLDAEGWLFITGRLKNLIIFSNGKNVYPEGIEAELARIDGLAEVVVYAGESRSQKGREVIVAEIFPDTDRLKALGIADAQDYFEAEVRKANSRMVAYKAIGQVKLRNTEFVKNTSRKIIRFAIDKNID